ncbi:MAG: helix-turn-helix domain-containing protein [Candidatus Eisenbacteria bacterium]|nr:helix-turn-helix domain-containing protein [Candidatus Eisenbacteria bacterium]
MEKLLEVDTLEYQKTLGERVRRFRRELQLTQMDLARQVGVTNGQISTIERGLSAPSIGTLRRISGAMGIAMIHFFDEPGQRDVVVVKKAERTRLTSPTSPEVLEVLAGSRNLVALQIGLNPGTSCQRPAHDSASELFLMIQQGQIEIVAEGQTVLLAAGDSARLDGRSGCSYRCQGEAPALVLEVRSESSPGGSPEV